MNFLAHAFLSFDKPDILVGNIISDFVKGKTKFNYPQGVQNGISLHRAIDEFTDAHPATKKAKEFFRPAYRLYSGAFVDVVYDHFLAVDTNEFENSTVLQNFTLQTYNTLEKNYSLLPPQFQNIFPHMKQHNWLYNYQFLSGMEMSFGGLAHRAAYLHESATAFTIFNKNYSALHDCYAIIFPTLKKFAANYVSNLLVT